MSCSDLHLSEKLATDPDLSEKLAIFLQRGGPGRFADALRRGNFFEAVAVAVTRGCEVLPHMDRENDHRDGWNVMGALTFCGRDEKGPFRVGVFGYTDLNSSPISRVACYS